jgi:hypothetical protein
VRIDKQVVHRAISVILVAALALGGLVAGFNLKEVEVPGETYKISTFDHNEIKYSLDIIKESKMEIPPSLEEKMAFVESVIAKAGNITMGDDYRVENGTKYHLMATESSTYAVIGETGAHKAGVYKVTGISIKSKSTGNIVYEENFDAKDSPVDMKEIAYRALLAGIDLSQTDDLEIYIHTGSSKAYMTTSSGERIKARAGWVKEDRYDFSGMPTSKVQVNTTRNEVSGTIENFTGSVITINGQDFKVLDENGNPLKPGTYTNAQGTRYEINSLSLEEVNKESTVTETKTVRRLSFNISPLLMLGVGLGIGLLAVLELARRKINKKCC